MRRAKTRIWARWRRAPPPHEAMMARLTLEPELAHLAALHATPLQIGAARALAAEMQSAADWDNYERLDHAFHDLLGRMRWKPAACTSCTRS